MSKAVLITDDALFMRVTLKNILTSHSHEVVGKAGNGEEAVQQYAAKKPNLVLMDITMPIMDGITATKAIKTSDPNAKIVMCTAMGQKNILIEALQTGAKDYIVKPFQPERVLKSIKKLIG